MIIARRVFDIDDEWLSPENTEIPMEKHGNINSGIQLLLKKYKELFRIPENVNFYSKHDYEVAERKFLKFALLEGGFEVQPDN